MTQQHAPAPFPGEVLRVTASPYMATLTFGAPGEGAERAGQAVTIPWPVAKQLALLLTKFVRAHELEYGALSLPPDSWKQMGIAPEDWTGPARP